MKMFAFMLGITLCFLPACSSRKRFVYTRPFGSIDYSGTMNSGSLSVTASQLYQAKLADVPVPFSSAPIDQFDAVVPTEQGMMLAYVVPMSFAGLSDFYSQEMEREGWRTMVHLEGPEIEFIFEKPSRICLISLRHSVSLSEEHTVLVIVIANR